MIIKRTNIVDEPTRIAFLIIDFITTFVSKEKTIPKSFFKT